MGLQIVVGESEPPTGTRQMHFAAIKEILPRKTGQDLLCQKFRQLFPSQDNTGKALGRQIDSENGNQCNEGVLQTVTAVGVFQNFQKEDRILPTAVQNFNCGIKQVATITIFVLNFRRYVLKYLMKCLIIK